MQNINLESPFGFTPLPSQNENMQIDPVQKFQFHGTASEYFGIWIVNILLTIITIGFYAPWAKVRRLRYFYGNTELIERRFDFTGIPSRILIGRLIAIGIYIGIAILSKYSVTIAVLGGLFIYAVIPWLVCATLRFRGRNSKFGNSRFYFSGTTKRAYLEFFKGLLITICTLGLFFPVLIWLFKRYYFNHLYIGQLKFNLRADWPVYMGAVYVPFLAFLGLLSCLGLISFLMSDFIPRLGIENVMIIAFVFYVTSLFIIWPWMFARIFIATWKNITLSESCFQTSCREWRYTWIIFSNWIVKIMSIGLMTPWAEIRLYKYQVESLSLQLNNDPDTMFNRLQNNPIGVAEEIADVFDFDISL
ncbi:hypothetical protein B9T31_10335 [Acinetobacter sp. ANC 4558]|uniref:YjgN family protein n=1 Tax=Acinetobacter sp. ANC 4558 TaxID=1977876 RepID=UPI000A35A8CA|nr:YjgN family protein [Acinetobacter sp. ANC 4558]OTG85978.1 hypothetical protein B9T31_10335 [Acinetobacter sp. ANC 4558]